MGLNSAENFQTIHLWQFQIQQDQLGNVRGMIRRSRRVAEDKIQSFYTVADNFDSVEEVVLVENVQRQLHVARVILYQQQLYGRLHDATVPPLYLAASAQAAVPKMSLAHSRRSHLVRFRCSDA